MGALASALVDGSLADAGLVASSRRCFARWIEAAGSRGTAWDERNPRRSPTAEPDVLERIAQGDSNKPHRTSLDLSPHTVKRHAANILDKTLRTCTRPRVAACPRTWRPIALIGW